MICFHEAGTASVPALYSALLLLRGLVLFAPLSIDANLASLIGSEFMAGAIGRLLVGAFFFFSFHVYPPECNRWVII